MNFDDLFQPDIQVYLDNAFVPKQMILYVHIPKCSGTSTVTALKESFPRNWHFEYATIDQHWDQFIERTTNQRQEPLELAAGHFWHWHLDSVRHHQVPCHGVTFFRHPIQRLVSEYRYMCTPAHPPSQEFVKQFPSFEAFVEGHAQPNTIARMLYNGVTSFDDYLSRLKRDFRFIGLSEFFHLGMAILMRSLDKPYRVQPRANVTLDNEQNRFDVSQWAHQRLLESQSLDLMVYDYLHAKYAEVSDRFIGKLYDGSFSL